MPTNLLALPELSIPCAIRTNEDWRDTVAFTDVNGNPEALDGIAFVLQCRSSADSEDVLFEASTDEGTLVLCSAGALVQPIAGGAGHAIGDVLPLAGGTGTIPATIVITALALASLAQAAVGAGHAPGDVLTLDGGVFSSPAQITVDTIAAGGAIATWHISAPGSYTVAPTTLVQSATTGSGTGAGFAAPLWGVAAARMTSAGSYAEVPENPVAQGASSGSGTGATFALTWVNNAVGQEIPAALIDPGLMLEANVYEIRGMADGDTAVVVSGALQVTRGVVR